MSIYQSILIEVDYGVGLIIFNCLIWGNEFNVILVVEFSVVIMVMVSWSEVCVLILLGFGLSFCGGVDL